MNIEMQAQWLYLTNAVQRAKEVHQLSATTLLPILYRSPLFDPDRAGLFEQALEAYFHGDSVKSIHVLLPQVEHSLRRLLAGMGKATDKKRSTKSNNYVMVEKNLNEILCEPEVVKALTPDAAFQFRMVLCDERGFNLRNNVLHGLVPATAFQPYPAYWLFHVVCWMSMLRERPTDA